MDGMLVRGNGGEDWRGGEGRREGGGEEELPGGGGSAVGNHPGLLGKDCRRQRAAFSFLTEHVVPVLTGLR